MAIKTTLILQLFDFLLSWKLKDFLTEKHIKYNVIFYILWSLRVIKQTHQGILGSKKITGPRQIFTLPIGQDISGKRPAISNKQRHVPTLNSLDCGDAFPLSMFPTKFTSSSESVLRLYHQYKPSWIRHNRINVITQPRN